MRQPLSLSLLLVPVRYFHPSNCGRSLMGNTEPQPEPAHYYKYYTHYDWPPDALCGVRYLKYQVWIRQHTFAFENFILGGERRDMGWGDWGAERKNRVFMGFFSNLGVLGNLRFLRFMRLFFIGMMGNGGMLGHSSAMLCGFLCHLSFLS